MTKALKKIPLKIWFFVFAIIFLMISVIQLPAVGAYDEDHISNIWQQYNHDNSSLRGAIKSYHNDMNDLMNDFSEKLIDGVDAGAPTCGETPCDSLQAEAICRASAPEKNVSTFCLAVIMTDQYLAFQKALDSSDEGSHSKHVDDKIKDEEESGGLETLIRTQARIDQSIEDMLDRQSLINEQVETAKQVLDTAIATYNQLLMYYRIHVAYEGVIESLEEYRDELSSVRNQVEKYPDKFHNVTTTECT